jgi:hypothetical protein
LQVREGNVIEVDGVLFEVTKQQHTQGHGRQLGNVQVTLEIHLALATDCANLCYRRLLKACCECAEQLFGLLGGVC